MRGQCGFTVWEGGGPGSVLTSSEALALGKPLGGRRTNLPQGSGTQPPTQRVCISSIAAS